MGQSDVKLAVVGSIGLDDIETPFEKRDWLLGGSVSYACAAASYFAPVGMVGIVGDDFPEVHIATYKQFGIDLAGLQQVEGETFRWGGVYEADMINRRTVFTELNVFETFSPTLPEGYQTAPYLLLGNISPDLQIHVLDQCRDTAFVVADTMDLWINIARESLMALISRVTMLTLNDSEARALTGLHNVLQCARKILEWGPRYVVIKKGEHGAMLVSEDGIALIPAYPVESVCDPTGAGDSFAGGFMGALAANGDTSPAGLREALLYGSVVASLALRISAWMLSRSLIGTRSMRALPN